MFATCLLIVISIILCPLSLLVLLSALVVNKIINRSYWGYAIFFLAGGIIFYIGHRLNAPIVPLQIGKFYLSKLLPFLNMPASYITIRSWIVSDLRTLGVTTMMLMVCLYLLSNTPERRMIRSEKEQEMRKLRPQKIDYLKIAQRSSLIFGVSGSGKTAFISKMMERFFETKRNSFLVICDGKGSTEEYSLLWAAKILAKRFRKRLVILNATSNAKIGGMVYDFLDGVTSVDAAKDMIMTLITDPTVKQSSGSEHYRTITEAYLSKFICFMMENDVDVTLKNLLMILDPTALKVALEQIKADPVDKDALLSYAQANWPDVKASFIKLQAFLSGEGRRIFTGDGKRFNIRKSYEHGAIVLILCSEMDQARLSSALMQLITMDIRNFVSGRLNGTIDMERKAYVFYDEFSSYTSSVPLIKSLYARARSADVVVSLATQSVSDYALVDESYFHVLADNSDSIVSFRQHSVLSSQSIAELLGTEYHVTNTSRVSNLASTGESSATSDKTYIISPDSIRTLPKNKGILLCKNEKPGHQIKCFKNQFIRQEVHSCKSRQKKM